MNELKKNKKIMLPGSFKAPQATHIKSAACHKHGIFGWQNRYIVGSCQIHNVFFWLFPPDKYNCSDSGDLCGSDNLFSGKPGEQNGSLCDPGHDIFHHIRASGGNNFSIQFIVTGQYRCFQYILYLRYLHRKISPVFMDALENVDHPAEYELPYQLVGYAVLFTLFL